jgi:hypothetical protein
MGADGRLFRSPVLWVALAVGIALRSVGLFQQVLVDDEIHAYHFVQRTPFPAVLWDFGNTANSPAFNVWLRLFLDLGIPPSELALRIPVLASGIALLIVAPWWVARQLGTHAAVVLAWLLALSPLLVMYSRIMRPYMPEVVLASAAVGAFYTWYQTRRRAAGVAYALLASMTTYVLLVGAPFVLAPFVFLAVEAALRGPAALPPRRDVVLVGAIVSIALLALSVAATQDLFLLTARRQATLNISLKGAGILIRRLVGTSVPALAVVVWVAAAAGAVQMARRAPALLRYLAVIVLGQVVGILLLAPKSLHNPVILARYLIVLVVPTLILVALGLAALNPVRRLLTPVLLAALFATGPLAQRDLYRGPLGVAPDVFNRRARPSRRPPDAYRVLSAGPAGDLVEYPFPPSARLLRPVADYWTVHRRTIRIGPGGSGLDAARLGLRSIVPGQPQALLDSGAAFLAVHRDWEREIGAALIAGVSHSHARRMVAQNLDWMRRDAARLAEQLENSWGPPDARDDAVAIWDLTRVRARVAAAGAPATRQ